jgi:hypothetical protein
MIADFATIMVDPPRVRCIGVDLLPFSLGHLLMLHKLENRFVVGGFPHYEDLISAAFVCAHTWEENQRLVNSWRARWILWAWGKMAGRFEIPSQIITLHQAIRSAVEMPRQRKTSRGGTRGIISEWETRMFHQLRVLGYSDSEILNMPYARAQKLFIAHLEETDAMKFMSQAELANEKAMTDIVEQMERGEIAA